MDKWSYFSLAAQPLQNKKSFNMLPQWEIESGCDKEYGTDWVASIDDDGM